jgi:hypothetical protein
MFDDLIKTPADPAGSAASPAGAGITPPAEDIFAGALAKEDSAPPKPQVFQPVNPDPNFAVFERPPSSSGSPVKKILVAAIIVLVLVLVFLGIWYAYNTVLPKLEESRKNKTVDNTTATTTIEQPQPAEQPVVQPETAQPETPEVPAQLETASSTTATTTETMPAEQPVAAATTTPTDVPAPVVEQPVNTQDSDSDGLTDEEEKLIGTNPEKVDSDDDGLFDRDEVKIYKTNPLVSDTDKDGFSDGSEVKNGYNPNGAGKLYEINPSKAE